MEKKSISLPSRLRPEPVAAPVRGPRSNPEVIPGGSQAWLDGLPGLFGCWHVRKDPWTCEDGSDGAGPWGQAAPVPHSWRQATRSVLASTPLPGGSAGHRSTPATAGVVPSCSAMSRPRRAAGPGGDRRPPLSRWPIGGRGGFLGVDSSSCSLGSSSPRSSSENGRRAPLRLGRSGSAAPVASFPRSWCADGGGPLILLVFSRPGELAGLRRDALATLVYVANWRFIMSGELFAAAAPSPLEHTWSLAIEEQFYIVWPPRLVMLHLGRRLRPSRRLWPVLSVAVVGAIASAIDMRLQYQSGASVMRLYEGTDTRSQDILVGAALAIGMAMWAQHRSSLPSSTALDRTPVQRPHPRRAPPAPSLPVLTGGICIVGVASASDPSRPGRSPEADSGRAPGRRLAGPPGRHGAVLAVRRTGCRTVRRGLLRLRPGRGPGRLLRGHHQGAHCPARFGNPAFRYVGKISYGAYLWHVPSLRTADRRAAPPRGLSTARGPSGCHPGRSHCLVLPGRGAHPAQEDQDLLGVAGLALDHGSIPRCGGGHRGRHGPDGGRSRRTASCAGAAYVGPPVKVMVFGDSVAWRMAFAMLASQPQDSYDVSIDNGAIIGCGLLRSTQYRLYGVDHPEVPACNSSAPAADQWPAQWQGDLEQFRPNVVVVLAGRWELSDRMIDGRWLHIGQPAFDSAVKQSLEQAVQVGTSTGALMELMTSPCFAPNEQPNGQVWPRTPRPGSTPTTPSCVKWRLNIQRRCSSTTSSLNCVRAVSTRNPSMGSRSETGRHAHRSHGCGRAVARCPGAPPGDPGGPAGHGGPESPPGVARGNLADPVALRQRRQSLISDRWKAQPRLA